MQFLALISLFVSYIAGPLSTDADKITGRWISPNKDLIVRCYKGSDGKYYGKLVWFKVYPGDKEEANCDIPQDQWVNKVVLSGFEYKDDEWSGGIIKNIRECNSYDAFIELQPDGTLKATGFIIFRWLSESIVFSKYNGNLPRQE